jgi:DNA topoisomerase-1
VDENGTPQSVTSTDVNGYLREISGAEITAKDFRTWGGTVLAAAELKRMGVFDTQTLGKANVKAAIETVSMSLGNTPTICRKSYIYPALIETYLDGAFKLGRSKRAGLSAHESATLAFLEKLAKPKRVRRAPSASPRTAQPDRSAPPPA